jgi:hypothetical protein
MQHPAAISRGYRSLASFQGCSSPGVRRANAVSSPAVIFRRLRRGRRPVDLQGAGAVDANLSQPPHWYVIASEQRSHVVTWVLRQHAALLGTTIRYPAGVSRDPSGSSRSSAMALARWQSIRASFAESYLWRMGRSPPPQCELNAASTANPFPVCILATCSIAGSIAQRLAVACSCYRLVIV